MEDLEFFSSILDKEVIDYYKKINDGLDGIEQYCLIVDLKRLIKDVIKDNKKEEVSFKLNTLIYKFNCFLFRKENELDSKFYNFDEMIDIEKNSLKIMDDVIDFESSNEVVSKIYLYLTSLVELQRISLAHFNDLLKKDELDAKNIYFFSGRRIDLEENQENMEKIYSYVKKLNR